MDVVIIRDFFHVLVKCNREVYPKIWLRSHVCVEKFREDRVPMKGRRNTWSHYGIDLES